jgi:hypothetical protein
MIVTGKRLESKMESQPLVKFNDSKVVNNVSSTTLLGLDIDNELSFSPHSDKICWKLSQRIALLRKIRSYLPLKQRLLYYNSIILPIITYAMVIWSSCNTECLYRVLRLQKRAARVILSTKIDAPSVNLFNKLNWIPFYELNKINCCSLVFKRLQGTLPDYINEHLTVNSQIHSRNTRHSKFNLVCPKYNRIKEGGKTFLVRACQIWNQLPLELKRSESLKSLKKQLRDNAFKKQQSLHHFLI